MADPIEARGFPNRGWAIDLMSGKTGLYFPVADDGPRNGSSRTDGIAADSVDLGTCGQFAVARPRGFFLPSRRYLLLARMKGAASIFRTGASGRPFHRRKERLDHTQNRLSEHDATFSHLVSS
jgi:hypothetical protein